MEHMINHVFSNACEQICACVYAEADLCTTVLLVTAALCSGDISISGGVTFDPIQLTLTCISTGGPATTVTWTRDNVNITGEQNETVLNDPVTAQYTHTLTVTTAGVYNCTVANNKPSSANATTTVAGIYSQYYVCTHKPSVEIVPSHCIYLWPMTHFTYVSIL